MSEHIPTSDEGRLLYQISDQLDTVINLLEDLILEVRKSRVGSENE
jgi:hypothetical protein